MKESAFLFQPLRIAFYGPPCTGKTYLAKLLAAYYDVKYISMAEIVGAFIQLRVRKYWEKTIFIDAHINLNWYG